jgi:hypothetical protein
MLVQCLEQCLELCASKQQQERRKAEEKLFSTEHIFRSSLGEPSVLNTSLGENGFKCSKAKCFK